MYWMPLVALVASGFTLTMLYVRLLIVIFMLSGMLLSWLWYVAVKLKLVEFDPRTGETIALRIFGGLLNNCATVRENVVVVFVNLPSLHVNEYVNTPMGSVVTYL